MLLHYNKTSSDSSDKCRVNFESQHDSNQTFRQQLRFCHLGSGKELSVSITVVFMSCKGLHPAILHDSVYNNATERMQVNSGASRLMIRIICIQAAVQQASQTKQTKKQ